MHIANVRVPRFWTKLEDLLVSGRTAYKIQADKTYYIHNNSDYILYLKEGDLITPVYARKSAGYVKAGAEDLYVSSELPTSYPYPEFISVVFCDNVKAETLVAVGDYDPKAEASVKGAYVYKGSVANKAALPAEAEVGDVYNLEDTGMNVAWTGTEWDELGSTVSIDLSGYAKAADVEAVQLKLEGMQDLINEVKAEVEGIPVVDLTPYATKEELSTKADRTDLNALAQEVDTEIEKTVLTIDGVLALKADKTELEVLATKEELAAKADTVEVYNALDIKASKAELAEAVQDAVDYQYFTYTNAEGETQTRKTIQLANYDSISGIDTAGTGHNLAMLSKWDVADFGAPGIHCNLNTLDTVTINDNDIVVVSKAFTHNGEERRTIQLANFDSISGVSTTGTGHNLVMLSKWDVADFGATGVHCNLNTLDTVTINDDKVVATTDLIEALEAKITALENRIAVLENA